MDSLKCDLPPKLINETMARLSPLVALYLTDIFVNSKVVVIVPS